jgi:DME family drug/metabolite transporter
MFRAGPLPVGRGAFYIAIAATAWGTGGAVAALLYSAGGLGSLSVSFWRFLGGAITLGIAWPLLRGLRRPSLFARFTAAPGRFGATGAGMAVYQTAYFAAVDHAGVAIATVVTLGSGPVLVTLGARLWMAEPLGRREALIVVSALAGLVTLVAGSGPDTGSTAREPFLGVGLAVLSAAGYAGTTLLGRAVGVKEGHDPAGDALIGFTVGSLCLLPLALASGLLPERGDTATVVAALAYLGLVPSALAYVLFFAGLRVVRATTASIITLVEPLAATTIAVWFLDEHLTPLALSGGALLLATVLVSATGANTPTAQ